MVSARGKRSFNIAYITVWKAKPASPSERAPKLPEDVDTKLIRAESKDAVLTVTLPKSATAKSKPVAITVQ